MDARPVIIVCLLLIVFLAALVAVPVNFVREILRPSPRRRDEDD